MPAPTQLMLAKVLVISTEPAHDSQHTGYEANWHYSILALQQISTAASCHYNIDFYHGYHILLYHDSSRGQTYR